MTRVYQCDRCGEYMERSTDCTTKIDGEVDVRFHHCEQCANEVREYAAKVDK